jgi:hypothetical protein
MWYSLTMHAGVDMKVVNVRAPGRIFVDEGADETHHGGCVLRHTNELVRSARIQALVPYAAAVLERPVIQELVGHHSAVGAPPAFRVKEGNGVGIVWPRRAECDRVVHGHSFLLITGS